MSIVIVDVPDVPLVVCARYESRGLLKVADEFVSEAALVSEGERDLSANREKAKERDKETKNTENVAKFIFVFTFFMT